MWTTRLIAGAFVLGTGCGHVAAHVPHPLDNQVRYLCCNLHYDKPEITDMNYLRGKVIPFGTRVQIREGSMRTGWSSRRRAIPRSASF